MNSFFDFLKIVEHLHYEKRNSQMSNGEKETVSAHSFMMSVMAMIFAPKLKTPVNMEHVLKLCTVHDLAESIAHDIPLHEQVKGGNAVCKNKYDCELAAMEFLCTLLGSTASLKISGGGTKTGRFWNFGWNTKNKKRRNPNS